MKPFQRSRALSLNQKRPQPTSYAEKPKAMKKLTRSSVPHSSSRFFEANKLIRRITGVSFQHLRWYVKNFYVFHPWNNHMMSWNQTNLSFFGYKSWMIQKSCWSGTSSILRVGKLIWGDQISSKSQQSLLSRLNRRVPTPQSWRRYLETQISFVDLRRIRI